MRSVQKTFQARASVIAVQGALLTLALMPAAHADSDADLQDAIRPTNTIEVGAINVGNRSNKFGEYNGLDKKEANFNAGFDIQGGDQDSATRWRVNADNLGLNTRSFGAEYGEQGKFRINFGYDELQRKQYDNYQTIYNGTGSTTLTLPGNLNASAHPAAISTTTLTANTPANVTSLTNVQNANALANPANIQSPNLSPGTLAAPNTTAAANAASANAGLGWLIPAAMHPVDIGTQRKKTDFGLSYTFSPEWSVKLSARNETKEGLKLTGVPSVSTGAGITAPELINYTTNLYSAALNYAGANSHVNVGYYASLFKNSTDTWNAASIWGNNTVQGNINRMVGTPDNQYHQFKIGGGYNFSKTTKLTMSGAYARSTQDESFIASGPFWYVPASNANAKIIDTHFLARLTSRVTTDLTLLGSVRYEHRDNKTPYLQTISTGRDAVGSVTAASTNPCGPGALPATAAVKVTGLTCYEAAPLNRKQEQVNLEADYKLARGQALKFGYEWQKVRRDSDVADENPFRTHETKENTLRFQYRNSMSEALSGRVGYDYSRRTHAAYELHDPLGGVLGAAVEPILPNLMVHMVAKRDRDKLRSSLTYIASDSLTLNGGLDYNHDKYKDDDFYGKKSAKSWVLNLDAAYAASEDLSLSGFYTYQDQKSEMQSLSILRASPTAINPRAAACGAYPTTASYSAAGAAVAYGSPSDWASDPCRIWGENQADKVHTLGLGFKLKSTTKLDLDGSLAYSRARTPITFSGLQVVNNGLSIGAYGANAAVNNNIWIPLLDMPESKSTMWNIQLGGKYAIDKVSWVRLNYWHQRLRSNDAQWDAYASNPVAIQGYVGTGVSAPNYSVNVVSATYVYTFK